MVVSRAKSEICSLYCVCFIREKCEDFSSVAVLLFFEFLKKCKNLSI